MCQITELLQLAPSTVSKHMSILRQADLVESRKDGRWSYYRLSLKHAPAAVAAMVNTLTAELATDARWQRDREAVQEILALDPEELCRRQCRPMAMAAGQQSNSIAEPTMEDADERLKSERCC